MKRLEGKQLMQVVGSTWNGFRICPIHPGLHPYISNVESAAYQVLTEKLQQAYRKAAEHVRGKCIGAAVVPRRSRSKKSQIRNRACQLAHRQLLPFLKKYYFKISPADIIMYCAQHGELWSTTFLICSSFAGAKHCGIDPSQRLQSFARGIHTVFVCLFVFGEKWEGGTDPDPSMCVDVWDIRW